MSEQLQLRSGSAANIATFTGAAAELVVDSTNNRLVLQDGATAGGFAAAKLSEVLTNSRTAVADAAYTALATDRMIAYTSLTTARAVMLPAASAYPTGTRLIAIDESGSCSATNTITLNRAGSDTINGATSAVIATAYGHLAIESNGSSKWIVDQKGGPLAPAAGTTATAPLTLTAGTNLTTPASGAIEYDGAAFYATVAANERGVLAAEQIQILSSPYTLTSTTSPQKMLNATANGAITLAAGTYEIEAFFSLTHLSSVSGTFGFALGGTATFTQAWIAIDKAGGATTDSTAQMTFNTAANTALDSATTNTNGEGFIKGILRVTVAGTVIPQISMSQASAAIVATNSYFKVKPLGGAAMTNVGNWS